MTILFSILATFAYAQDEIENEEIDSEEYEEYEDYQNEDDDMQTLVSSGGVGGYGGLTVGYTQIGENSAFVSGIRGGVVLGHSFTFGIAGYGFITEQFQNPTLSESNYYQMAGGYGGLLLETIVLPLKPVHISIPVIMGAGGISYFRSYNFHDSYDWEDYAFSDLAHDVFFVIEPGIEIDINMLKFMRISLGGSYRYTTDVDLKTYVDFDGILSQETLAQNDILNGWNAYLTFKFGAF